MPWAFRPYTANVLAVYMIYGMLALSLTLIWGYAGIMSFGQTAFFGIGAYAYGAIGLNLINRQPSRRTWPSWAGSWPPTLLAAVVGYFMFYGRISDVYVSIITLALTLVLFAFAVSTGGDEWVIGVARFGGFNGMFGQGESSQNIANFQIPPVTVWLPGMAEPFEFKINRESAAGYFLVLGVSVLVYAWSGGSCAHGWGAWRSASARTRPAWRASATTRGSTSSRCSPSAARSPASPACSSPRGGVS